MTDHLANKDVDLTFLYEIADGSDEFIVDSIGMFLEQSPQILQEVQDAITIQDWPEAARAAHKIKANLGFFGMLNSQAIIQEIEIACKSGTPDAGDVTNKFNQVKGILEENLDVLEQVKAEKEANL